MAKQHLKALNTPRTWTVLKHKTPFTTRPNAGPHSFELSVSLNHVLKDHLGLSMLSKESRLIVNKRLCIIDGKPARDIHAMVGFMDTLSIPEIAAHYRMTLTAKGKLALVKIKVDETKHKIVKVTSKALVTGGVFKIGTNDGRTITTKDAVPGDSLVIEVPSQKVIKRLPLENGMHIILIGGKHIGTVGVVESVTGDSLVYQIGDTSLTTLKKYAFVLGKKPEVTVREN